jgi:hypothetical protein
MKTQALILASVALFALGVSSADAGPCTTEIEGLTKTLAAKDAGSGPTPRVLGETQSVPRSSDQHPPTAAMSQATQGQATSAEDVRSQTAGQPPAAQQGTTGAVVQHPPTAAMSQATQGQTASVTPGQHPPTAGGDERSHPKSSSARRIG